MGFDLSYTYVATCNIRGINGASFPFHMKKNNKSQDEELEIEYPK